METAILTVGLILSMIIGAFGWTVLAYANDKCKSLEKQIKGIDAQVDAIRFQVDAIKDVLTEASRILGQRTAPQESTFDKANDKIPASLRYTPIARRRAAAEAASASPASHKAEVTANNARVMETL